MNTYVVTNSGESRVDDKIKDDEDWGFDGAVGLDEVERVGVTRQSRNLQESFVFKHRKVLDIVTKVVHVVDELVRRGSEQSARVANGAVFVALSRGKREIVSLSVSSKKIWEEVHSAEVEMSALHVVAELAMGEHNVALVKVRVERQDGVEA